MELPPWYAWTSVGLMLVALGLSFIPTMASADPETMHRYWPCEIAALVLVGVSVWIIVQWGV